MSSLVRLHPLTDGAPIPVQGADLRGRYVVLVSLAGRPLVGCAAPWRVPLGGVGFRDPFLC